MKNSIRNIMFLFELTLSFSIYGCAGIWWEHHKDLYDELGYYKIKTIAILPIRNSNLDTNETKEVNQYFMSGITKIMKNYILISPEESLEKLDRDSLTKRYYNQLAVNYSSASEKLIKDVGKSIACDAIVRVEISNINKSTYPDQNKASTSCWVSYIINSTKDGEIIWGNIDESYIKTDLTSPPPLIKVVKAGIDRLFLYTHN